RMRRRTARLHGRAPAADAVLPERPAPPPARPLSAAKAEPASCLDLAVAETERQADMTSVQQPAPPSSPHFWARGGSRQRTGAGAGTSDPPLRLAALGDWLISRLEGCAGAPNATGRRSTGP